MCEWRIDRSVIVKWNPGFKTALFSTGKVQPYVTVAIFRKHPRNDDAVVVLNPSGLLLLYKWRLICHCDIAAAAAV